MASAFRFDPPLDIAVIIVTYKSARLTIEALESLVPERSIPGLRIRVVVVDNCSGDLPIIARAVSGRAWSDWISLIMAPTNGGFAYGNNLGIRCANAAGSPSYFYLLNPDAQIRPGAIGSLAHFLETHPAVGIVGGSFENLDGSDWPLAFRFPNILSELNQGLETNLVSRMLNRWAIAKTMGRLNEPVDWICGASMLIRPEVFSAIGGLDENYFLYFEETDFCRRARAAGFSTWYVPESRVMHIAGQSTRVMQRDRAPKRLPGYWFESRRRYFAVAFGVPIAMVVDLVALVAYSLGTFKRVLQGRPHSAGPRFIRDLLSNSVLRPKNWRLPSPRCDVTSSSASRLDAIPAETFSE